MAAIKARSIVRSAFSDCSTGNAFGCYYETKGHAIKAYDDALRVHGYHFDENELFDFSGDAGRRNINIVSGGGEYVGVAVVSWYRMDSGRYEFTGYIA